MDKTYHFKFGSGGSIPPGAKPNGNEAPPTSDPLWVARTIGGTTGLPIVQLGKVRPGFGGALFPFGGKEVFSLEYEVLMEAGLWVTGDPGGKIPIGAVVCAEDASGEPLFVARAALSGGVHPGKTRAGWGVASIGLGGSEHSVSPFEILVANDNALHF